MKRYIVANWKMNMLPAQAMKFLDKFDELSPTNYQNVQTVIAPPFVDLPQMKERTVGNRIELAAQNISEFDQGTYTGEISGPLLRGFVEYSLVGHSERRQILQEKDHSIAKKVAAALRNNIRPILCVGDDLHQRQEGLSKLVIVNQLESSLSEITAEDLPSILVAYEPIWAISKGDGRAPTPTPDDISEMNLHIRKILSDLFGAKAAAKPPILYGGSANPDNTTAILKSQEISGLLIGGASLKVDQFVAMIDKAHNLPEN
ncbi:triose-phosphate isomerase [Candidatus Saccharibacteria bacterium]|nr:triose-phosphate isomerase [Candidatus Saccharibacteria bacterium]